MIQATYPVSVTGGMNGDNRVRDMMRNINILRIDLRFVCVYCHCAEEMALGSHSCMLRTVYRIARFLRQLLWVQMNRNCSDTLTFSVATAVSGEVTREIRTERLLNDMDGVGNDSQLSIPNITLRDMLPGRSEKEKVIGANLKMSKDMFARLNINVPRDIDSSESAMPSSSNDSRRGAEDIKHEFDSDDDVMAGMLD